jgi:hypothetical protein
LCYRQSVQLSEEEWLSVLDLSIQWGLKYIRTSAIKNLFKRLRDSPLQLITYGEQYDINDWVFIGVEILVLREEPLGEEEVATLGIAEVLKLASIRECLTGFPWSPQSRLVRGKVSRSRALDLKIHELYGLHIPYPTIWP